MRARNETGDGRQMNTAGMPSPVMPHRGGRSQDHRTGPGRKYDAALAINGPHMTLNIRRSFTNEDILFKVSTLKKLRIFDA
jgi:hypothetical protein